MAVAVAGIALGLGWPVPIAPGTWWIGNSGNDHASLAWTLDLVADKLAHGHLPWGHTDRIEYPKGTTLLPAYLPGAIAVAPVTLTLGAVAALNLLAVLHHALTAGLAVGWLRREGAELPGAVAGALALAFAPAMVTGTWNGNPDVTPWYWIPAALWLAAGAGTGRAMAAGLAVAAAGACNPYVGVMTGFVVIARLTARRAWRELAIVGVLAALGALGVYAANTAALSAADAGIAKGGRVGSMGTATVLGLVRPTAWVIRTDAVWELPRVGVGTYLGLSTLGLALLARRHRRLAWGLVALGVVAALGPWLRLWDPVAVPPGGGPPPTGGETGIPLPWALAELLPGLRELTLTARFTGLAITGLALLAALGTARLGRWQWAAPALVLIDLLGVAGGAASFRAAPVPDDGACALLEPLEPGPVVDLPPTFHELWMLAQLCHRRPVAEGINRPLPQRLGRHLQGRDPSTQARRLHEDGFRWLVAHEHPAYGAWRELIAELGPCRVAANDEVAVYDLSCGPATRTTEPDREGPSRPGPRPAPAPSSAPAPAER